MTSVSVSLGVTGCLSLLSSVFCHSHGDIFMLISESCFVADDRCRLELTHVQSMTRVGKAKYNFSTINLFL